MPRSSSVPKAVTASRSCIFLAQSIKDVIPSSHWLAFFSQYLFSSAIIILLCVMRATDQGAVNTAMMEVGTAIECLGTLEASWPGAKKCGEILKELADITLSKVRETVGMPSPSKRDCLTIAAGNIIAGSHSPVSKTCISPPNASLAQIGMFLIWLSFVTAKKLKYSLDLLHRACTPVLSHKRTLDEMNEFNFTSSPGLSILQDHHKSHHQPMTPDSLGHGQSVSVPNPYSLGESPISPPLQQWSSTPRSSGITLCGSNTLAPVDYLMTQSSSEGLESITQPFSFNTSTSTTPKIQQQLDSACLSSFTFPIYDDSTSNNGPSSTQFDLSDLPFSGLDFLQSFTSFQDGITGTEEGDPLWSQLSASPFKMGPELPFALIEGQVLS